METLKVDEKWSVKFDPSNNDRPVEVFRYEQDMCLSFDNFTLALFYALLEDRNNG